MRDSFREALDWVIAEHGDTLAKLAEDERREELDAARRALLTWLAWSARPTTH